MLRNKYIYILITIVLFLSFLTNPAAAQDESLNIAIPGRAQTMIQLICSGCYLTGR